MEDKQTRILTLLSVILLVLVGLIVFIDPPKDSGGDDEGEVSWTRIWPDATSDGVQSARLELASGEKLSFEKSEGGWKVTAGGASFAAEDRKVSNLVEDVLTAEIASDEASPGDLAAFGLAPPVAIVTLVAGDGKESTLRVGRDTPVGYGTYVQREEGGPVLRARARLSATLGTGLADFRDKALVRFSESEVSALSLLATPACAPEAAPCPEPAPIKLEKDDHGWWLRAPVQARADGDRVDGLLSALVDLRADAFVADPSVVVTPDLTLELTVGETRETLTFGPDDGGRVARVPAQPEPVRLGGPLPESLSGDAQSWLDGRLLPVRLSSLTRVDLKLGDATLSAERAEAGWSNPQAEGALDALEAARVDRKLVAEAPSGAAWGVLELVEGEARKERVRVHQALADGGRVAVDEAGGAPFVIPAAELKRLTDAMSGLAAPAN